MDACGACGSKLVGPHIPVLLAAVPAGTDRARLMAKLAAGNAWEALHQRSQPDLTADMIEWFVVDCAHCGVFVQARFSPFELWESDVLLDRLPVTEAQGNELKALVGRGASVGDPGNP